MITLKVVEGPSYESDKKIAKIDNQTRRQLGVSVNDKIVIVGKTGSTTAIVRKIGREYINQGIIVLTRSIIDAIGAKNGSRVEVRSFDEGGDAPRKSTRPKKKIDIKEIWIEPGRIGYADPEDVVLVMDTSGSMSEDAGLPSGISKIEAVKDAISQFLETKTSMNENDVVSLVVFTSSGKIMHELTTDYSAIIQASAQMYPHNGTLLEAGISKGYEVLGRGKSPLKRMILLTDGHGGDPTHMIIPRQKGSQGIRIDTVGVGAAVNADILIRIAEMTGGKYVFISDFGSLGSEFRKISHDKGL